MKWSAMTKSKNGKITIILKFKIINRGSKKINPIKKFSRLVKIEDKGIISRGNIFCFKVEELARKEFADSVRAFIEKNQGIIPLSAKRV